MKMAILVLASIYFFFKCGQILAMIHFPMPVTAFAAYKAGLLAHALGSFCNSVHHVPQISRKCHDLNQDVTFHLPGTITSTSSMAKKQTTPNPSPVHPTKAQKSTRKPSRDRWLDPGRRRPVPLGKQAPPSSPQHFISSAQQWRSVPIVIAHTVRNEVRHGRSHSPSPRASPLLVVS